MTERTTLSFESKYVIATYTGGDIIFWQDWPGVDWKWTRARHDAKIFSSLAEAQAEAVRVAFTYPRYIGLLEVAAVHDAETKQHEALRHLAN